MNEPRITLNQVAIGHGRRQLLEPISLTVNQGEFWGIVGPNGAGKTTLVRTMIGLVRPVSGLVVLARPDLHFGYVPQRHTLNPEYPLSAFEVALMGRYDHRPSGRRLTTGDRDQVRAALAELGMADNADHPFRALSGGQQQRVLLARALASEPDVLFLDEPTEGIDVPGEADILAFLGRLHRERGMTILMVVHHMDQVGGVVDHLCLINRHTGLFKTGAVSELMVEGGLSDVYDRPVELHDCDGWMHVHVKDREP